MKKRIILLMTLAIPVAVFLFLKIFGENKYEIPVYFEQGIEGCSDLSQPHTVNMDLLRVSPKNYCVIGLMDSLIDEDNRAFVTELIRIQDAFYGRAEPQFILLTDSDSQETQSTLMDLFKENGLNPAYTTFVKLNTSEMQDFIECGLGFGKPDGGEIEDLALVDEEGKIRGFYARNDREQTDRLILELKILKNDK